MDAKDMAQETGRDAMYVLEYIVLMQERILRNDESEDESSYLDRSSSFEEIRSLLAEKNRNDGISETESSRPCGSSTIAEMTSEDDVSFLDGNSALEDESSETETELQEINESLDHARFLEYELMTKTSEINSEDTEMENDVKQPVNQNMFYTFAGNYWNSPESVSLAGEEPAANRTMQVERMQMLENMNGAEEQDMLKSNEVRMGELGTQEDMEMFERDRCWNGNYSYDACEEQQGDLIRFEELPKPQNCVINAFFMQVDAPKCDEKTFVPTNNRDQKNLLKLPESSNIDEDEMIQNKKAKYDEISDTTVGVSVRNGKEDINSAAQTKVTSENVDTKVAAIEKQLEEIISFYRNLQNSLLTLLHRKTRLQVELFDCKIRFSKLRNLQNENLPNDQVRRSFIKVCKRIDSLEDKLDIADIKKLDLKRKMAQCRRDAKELQKQCTSPIAKKIRKVLSAM